MLDWWLLGRTMLWVLGLACLLVVASDQVYRHMRSATKQLTLGTVASFIGVLGLSCVGIAAVTSTSWRERLPGGLLLLAGLSESLRMWSRTKRPPTHPAVHPETHP